MRSVNYSDINRPQLFPEREARAFDASSEVEKIRRKGRRGKKGKGGRRSKSGKRDKRPRRENKKKPRRGKAGKIQIAKKCFITVALSSF